MSILDTQATSNELPRVTHYGTIRIDTLAFDCVVLEDATRGYVQSQLMQAIGFRKTNPSTQFRRFLTETAPNALILVEKTKYEVVKMPHGGLANFAPAGILTEIVTGVIDAALDGKLHTQRRGLIKPCQAINRALAKTGEVALIDEASGYQYHRAPDALQDLFSRLIRETCSDWERRFHPDYYEALYRLFGWQYQNQSQRPQVIGLITDRFVYGSVFPQEIMDEIRERRDTLGRFDKLHQWLQAGGLSLLEKQIAAVTMIARSSIDYFDFKARCKIAFYSKGQLGLLFPSKL